MPRRAVFLDRDGTMLEIVRRPKFPKKLTAPFEMKEYKIVSGLHVALADIHDLGFMRIMITNQPDVAYGYMKDGEWEAIHRRFLNEVPLEDFQICRCLPEANCPMKKPLPGMIIAAADKYGIDRAQSFMIGDTEADMRAGRAAGCCTILISADYNCDVKADRYADNMSGAVRIVEELKDGWDEDARGRFAGLPG